MPHLFKRTARMNDDLQLKLMGDALMPYDDNDKNFRKQRSDEAWQEYFNEGKSGKSRSGNSHRTYIEPRNVPSKNKKKKSGKKAVVKSIGRNARPIIVGLVALLLAAVLVVAAVQSFGNNKGKNEDDQQVSSSAPDERDDLISRLEQDNAEKDKKIGEYESRISELEAQLAAKKNGIKDGNNTKTCYLTFDDGPSNNTERILDILKENGVKATFFVIGRSSRLELVKREKEEGHTVALHTYSHEYDDVYRSTDAFFADLQKISDAVENIIGEKCSIIRFPGDSSNTVSKSYCKGIMTELTKQVEEKGYSYVDWNSDSGDATGNNVAVDKIMNNIRKGGTSAPTMVVLMHDTDAKRTTAEALPQIIQFYKDAGYGFAAITKDTPPVHHSVNN